MEYLLNTYVAFVEAIIPWTPKLAAEYGEIQYYGAIDSLTYEYLILSLYKMGGILLLKTTAETLDMAAKELVFQGRNEDTLDFKVGVRFSVLTPSDRLSAINILKQQEISSYYNFMPSDKYIIDNLIKNTIMGYYSEWFGYGSTRLEEANQRRMEFVPISWKQVEYPGPINRK